MTEVIKACNNKEKPYSFISYSHDDTERVYPILKKLHENGYRFWFDQHIESGTKWADTISKWLTHDMCSLFIVFISQNSLASENVQDEVHIARKHKKRCLVSVCWLSLKWA